MAKVKKCTGLFAHTLEKMTTVDVTHDAIHKRCEVCGYTEALPRSRTNTYFVNNHVLAHKKLAADSTVKELLQPLDNKGNVNDDFTLAYGYNPFDPTAPNTAAPKPLQGVR